MPRTHVVNAYRTEEVNLQPHGNTISVTTLAENPFESEGEIEIVTQESGGMSGPDPRMTSAGQRGVNRGMWGSRRRRATAQRRVLGLSPVAAGRFNAYDKGVHGLGALPSWVVGSQEAQQMQAAQDAKDAEETRKTLAAVGQIGTSLAQAGAQIYGQQQQAKIAASGARAADAAARAAAAQAAAAMAAGRQAPKSNKGMLLGLGAAGLAVVAIGIFLLMRKK